MRYIPVFILIIIITLCLLGAGCTSPAKPGNRPANYYHYTGSPGCYPGTSGGS